MEQRVWYVLGALAVVLVASVVFSQHGEMVTDVAVVELGSEVYPVAVGVSPSGDSLYYAYMQYDLEGESISEGLGRAAVTYEPLSLEFPPEAVGMVSQEGSRAYVYWAFRPMNGTLADDNYVIGYDPRANLPFLGYRVKDSVTAGDMLLDEPPSSTDIPLAADLNGSRMYYMYTRHVDDSYRLYFAYRDWNTGSVSPFVTTEGIPIVDSLPNGGYLEVLPDGNVFFYARTESSVCYYGVVHGVDAGFNQYDIVFVEQEPSCEWDTMRVISGDGASVQFFAVQGSCLKRVTVDFVQGTVQVENIVSPVVQGVVVPGDMWVGLSGDGNYFVFVPYAKTSDEYRMAVVRVSGDTGELYQDVLVSQVYDMDVPWMSRAVYFEHEGNAYLAVTYSAHTNAQGVLALLRLAEPLTPVNSPAMFLSESGGEGTGGSGGSGGTGGTGGGGHVSTAPSSEQTGEQEAVQPASPTSTGTPSWVFVAVAVAFVVFVWAVAMGRRVR